MVTNNNADDHNISCIKLVKLTHQKITCPGDNTSMYADNKVCEFSF